MMAVLVDTGVIYALADTDDSWHSRCREWLNENREPLVVPVIVIPEAAYLIHARLGLKAEMKFVRALARGELQIEPVTRADVERCVSIMEAHPEIGMVDATVVAVAERMKAPAIATTDRRHFEGACAARKLRCLLVP
jgi:predicted nucleic acid-binding protein